MHIVEANRAKIPAIGLGTWELRGRTCARVVEQALRLGYRHIDTAQMYDNERDVGDGLRASGVPRNEVFLTTKIWPLLSVEISTFGPDPLNAVDVRPCIVRQGFCTNGAMNVHAALVSQWNETGMHFGGNRSRMRPPRRICRPEVRLRKSLGCVFDDGK